MKFSYKFSNVLGSVYNRGTLVFTPDGNTILSPIGNKIICFDLKNNRSHGLQIEAEYNFSHLALNNTGSILLAATEKNQVYLCSMISGTVLHRKDYKKLDKINALGFSPNGKYFVICGSNRALIYLTPGYARDGRNRVLSPFKIHRVVKAHYDDTTCFSWSRDSRLLAIGSKDLSIKVVAVSKRIANVPFIINLSGHSDAVVKCLFSNDSSNDLDIYSLSSNCQVCVWKATFGSEELSTEPGDFLNYTKEKRLYLNEHLKTSRNVKLTTADYHSSGKLLITGYSNGSFLLQEMPSFTVIHSLELSTSGPIDSILFNNTGDWIAIASGIGGDNVNRDEASNSNTQLVVWEWQSESFVLKQSGTGAGYTNVIDCIAYGPDGSVMASGSTDGKIKLWNTFTNLCFATFNEHKGPITCIEFVPNKGGKVILSASLDGTVRAFDMNRYRNFRTLSAVAEPAQFCCLAVDSLSGDFVAAGSQNLFEVFLWSLTSGRLLESLTGHEAPISAVKFSPSNSLLVSTSWDGTARIWDLFKGSKCIREVVTLGTDGLALAFRADGLQFAVSTLSGSILLFDPNSGEQLGDGIDGRADLEMSQMERSLIKEKNKFFTCLSYSMDGQYIIAGGKSKYICLYNVPEKILVKKFAITWNLSMDGMYDYISKRKVAEFGFNLAKVLAREEGRDSAAINLPGVKRGDFSSRSVNPEIAVLSVEFSPTMRSFMVSTTEGVLIYSLDVANNFDPFQLTEDITPASVLKALDHEEYAVALMQAIKLNDPSIIKQVFEGVPSKGLSLVSSALTVPYVEKALKFLAICLEESRHIDFYLLWIQTLLLDHGVQLKSLQLTSLNATLRSLQRNLTKHMEDIGRLCDHNKYLLSFIHSKSSIKSESSD